MNLPKRFTHYPTALDIARASQRDYHRDYSRKERKAHIRLVLKDIGWCLLGMAIGFLVGTFLVWRLAK